MLPPIHTVTVKGASTHALAADRKTHSALDGCRQGDERKTHWGIGGKKLQPVQTRTL